MIDIAAYVLKVLIVFCIFIFCTRTKPAVFVIPLLLVLAFILGVEVITLQDNQWEHLLTTARASEVQAAFFGGAIGCSLMGFVIAASASFIDWFDDLSKKSKPETKEN